MCTGHGCCLNKGEDFFRLGMAEADQISAPRISVGEFSLRLIMCTYRASTLTFDLALKYRPFEPKTSHCGVTFHDRTTASVQTMRKMATNTSQMGMRLLTARPLFSTSPHSSYNTSSRNPALSELMPSEWARPNPRILDVGNRHWIGRRGMVRLTLDLWLFQSR